jgi:two-component system nitrogen regulation sensor histidine kinase GlnL
VSAFDPARVLNALALPVVAVDAEGRILEVNSAAEQFFEMGRKPLLRLSLADILPFGSPVMDLVAEMSRNGATVNGYRVDIATARSGSRLVDVFIAPLPEPEGGSTIMLRESTIAEKMDRQLTNQGAARSITALGAMLAHEIKNPLSGIRGAAQLLEASVSDDDRALTQLICAETDRIVKLVDRVDSFSGGRSAPQEDINIHSVLDHVKRLAQAGFARHIRFTEVYDPSLPTVRGVRDHLVQAVLNLVKNAAEAIGEDALDGEIGLSTAFRPGVRLRTQAGHETLRLPLEVCVRDNGPGSPPDIAANVFDPFVSGKTQGTGLGLALVAKVVGDHGGVIEFDSRPRRTTFRILLPASAPRGTALAEGGDA